MSKGFASNYRIVLLASGIFLTFVGLGSRLVYLHVIDRPELMKFVTKARRQLIPEPARRGDILDAKGNILASSRTLRELGVDPQMLRPEDEAKHLKLAQLIGMPLTDLRKIFATKTWLGPIRKPAAMITLNPVVSLPSSGATAEVSDPNEPVQPEIPPLGGFANSFIRTADETPDPDDDGSDDVVLEVGPDANAPRLIRWAKLSDHIEESLYVQVMALGIKGIYGQPVYRRAYPHNQLAAHLVGFVSKSGKPASGVERYADFYLRGQDGWREGERDGHGREAAQFRSREVLPSDGYNVTLSIDIMVQHLAEEEIDSIVKKFSPQKATIIVSDPRTGFILALANYPTFNLNEYAKADIASERNIAVTDQLDPGSTFKIVATSGALNDGLVTPFSTFNCSIPSIEYKGKIRRFMPDEHRYDHDLAVSEIIMHSSNIGAAQLGMQLGEQRMYDYARAFGYGERSGFPFGGEISGVLNRPEKWSDLEITRIPAGYSVSATPMQIHYGMSVIANGGLLMRPQLISEVHTPSGELVFKFAGAAKRRVVSQQTAEAMATMLMGVVTADGTAPDAAIPDFQVAGKTGTAQKLVNGHYSTVNHVGSFVGFFPAIPAAHRGDGAEDNPRKQGKDDSSAIEQVAISVIVDDGKVPGGGSAYGRVVAAPSFKHLGEQLIQYLNIKPVKSAPARNMVALGGVGR